MSTAPAVERHVRVCPQHRVEIQERGSRLVCPKGWHPIGKFNVVDRLKARVVEADADGGGIKEMSTTRPVAVAPTPASARKGDETMTSAKFKDAAGASLYIRLVRHRTARYGDVFLVRWQREVDGKYQGNGLRHRGDHAEPARTAFEKAAKEAKADGWEEVPVGARQIKFAPLPEPAKKGGR